MLNDIARDRIRETARSTSDNHYQSTDNKPLTDVMSELRRRWPQHFHTDASLDKRVFYHQPADYVPCAGYMVPRPKAG